MGPKSVVIQDEVLKWHVRGEEGNEGSLGVQTEGVIVEVDRMKVGQCEQRSEQV